MKSVKTAVHSEDSGDGLRLYTNISSGFPVHLFHTSEAVGSTISRLESRRNSLCIGLDQSIRLDRSVGLDRSSSIISLSLIHVTAQLSYLQPPLSSLLSSRVSIYIRSNIQNKRKKKQGLSEL